MKSSKHPHQSPNQTARWIIPGMALVICAGLTALFWPGVGTWLGVLQFEIQRQLTVLSALPYTVHG